MKIDTFIKENLNKNRELNHIIDSLSKLIDGTLSDDYRVLLSITELVHIFSFRGTKIILKEVDSEFSLNIYTMLFAPSGAGKDKNTTIIRGLFRDIYKDYLLPHQKQIAVRRKLESIPSSIMSLSTFAGLEKNLSEMSSVKFGSMLVTLSELGISIENNTEDVKSMFELLIMGYDLGNIISKSKASKAMQNKNIVGLNVSLEAYSSIERIKSKGTRKLLYSYFIAGLSRRTTVCIQDSISDKKISNKSIDTLISEYSAKNKEEDRLKESLRIEIMDTMADFMNNCNGRISVSDDVRAFHQILIDYKKENIDSKAHDEIVLLNLLNKPTKILKLSGLIAILERKYEINMDHYFQAYNIINRYDTYHCRIAEILSANSIKFFLNNVDLSSDFSITLYNLVNKYQMDKEMFTKVNIDDTLALLNAVSEDKGEFSYKSKKLFFKRKLL